MEGKQLRGKPRTRSIDQIRKDIEMRAENGKKYKLREKNRKSEIKR